MREVSALWRSRVAFISVGSRREGNDKRSLDHYFSPSSSFLRILVQMMHNAGKKSSPTSSLENHF